MITCPICDNIYSEKRSHCPTCACDCRQPMGIIVQLNAITDIEMVVAQGAERARQLPQSPIRFETVD